MTKKITSAGKFSLPEFQKSLRDTIIVSLGALIPPIIEFFQAYDFGEYQIYASAIFGLFAPFLNRWVNIIRVK